MNHNPPLIPRVSPYAVWYYLSTIQLHLAEPMAGFHLLSWKATNGPGPDGLRLSYFT